MVMVHIVVVLVMRVWSGRWVATIWKKYCPHLLLLRWRYSLGWALASFTIRLQALQSLALSPHSFIPIFLRSVDTSSSHLIFGLPLSPLSPSGILYVPRLIVRFRNSFLQGLL